MQKASHKAEPGHNFRLGQTLYCLSLRNHYHLYRMCSCLGVYIVGTVQLRAVVHHLLSIHKVVVT